MWSPPNIPASWKVYHHGPQGVLQAAQGAHTLCLICLATPPRQEQTKHFGEVVGMSSSPGAGGASAAAASGKDAFRWFEGKDVMSGAARALSFRLAHLHAARLAAHLRASASLTGALNNSMQGNASQGTYTGKSRKFYSPKEKGAASPGTYTGKSHKFSRSRGFFWPIFWAQHLRVAAHFYLTMSVVGPLIIDTWPLYLFHYDYDSDD